ARRCGCGATGMPAVDACGIGTLGPEPGSRAGRARQMWQPVGQAAAAGDRSQRLLARVNDGTQENTTLIGSIVAGTAVHRCHLVPHQHVADPPLVVVDEPVLGRMVGELVDESPRLV